ncbi:MULTISPECIES: hypothetical protein [unclassified Streptomyces]|uniref:hypothetical protein n=1 Tax=unclassified Streptomyces TaxID=2593676 RepID=UPI00226F9DF1|nr:MULTISPECIES: hypothetical protein [unclassified Streptomyces]MCY0922771.1 hypothetical protein [Streptomyces sp. H27-G5]MCY0961751.1 hypothetical protein [Streptomyces sp. H27-H5]
MRPEAPPTPEEVARAIAFEQEHAESEPADESAGRRLAVRLYEDCLSAQPEQDGPEQDGPDLMGFIKHISEQGSVTNEDRGPDRAFWSFKSQPEGADRAIPHRFLARAYGESRGLQVLEDTPAGNRLNGYFLGNEFVVDALAQHFDFEPEELDAAHGAAWDTLSDRYAEAAEGLVITFAADITEDSVLGKTEMPKLLGGSNVGKDRIRFAVPMPRHEHLPPEIDAFIANDPVRCQLLMGDYDPAKSPEEFAMKLDAIDVPEDQREAHQHAVERLSTATSYEELNPATPDTKRSRVRTNSFLPGVNVGHSIVPASRRGPTSHGAIEPAAPHIAPKPAGIEH